jgi:hypothetical protein
MGNTRLPGDGGLDRVLIDPDLSIVRPDAESVDRDLLALDGAGGAWLSHFHAEYQGQQATLTFDGRVLAGTIRSRTHCGWSKSGRPFT